MLIEAHISDFGHKVRSAPVLVVARGVPLGFPALAAA